MEKAVNEAIFDFGSGGPAYNISVWSSSSVYNYSIDSNVDDPNIVSSVAVNGGWQVVAMRVTKTD
jgi:hypothetical protein